MRTPKFWKNKNLVSNLLLPLGEVYGYITKKRALMPYEYKANIPVICIGNVTAGGTGKTPTAISIAKMLEKPNFISRGYGGSLNDVIVEHSKHTAFDVGDEPMLLANHFPTIINSNRAEAAKVAEKNGAKCIVMDDGLQNPKLHKTLSFVVIDGEYGFGNFRYVPAGPMREKEIRADAVIIIGKDKYNIAKNIKKPIFYAKIEPIKPNKIPQNVFAFAGIGRPKKFYKSLKECGIGVAKTRDFPDHYKYKDEDIKAIIRQSHGLEMWTTAKDFVKIPSKYRKKFHVLEIEIKWQDEKAIKDFILSKIK